MVQTRAGVTSCGEWGLSPQAPRHRRRCGRPLARPRRPSHDPCAFPVCVSNTWAAGIQARSSRLSDRDPLMPRAILTRGGKGPTRRLFRGCSPRLQPYCNLPLWEGDHPDKRRTTTTHEMAAGMCKLIARRDISTAVCRRRRAIVSPKPHAPFETQEYLGGVESSAALSGL